MSDTFSQLLQTVHDVKGDDTPAALDASTPIERLKFDSLDEVEIMMLLEERLGIEIDPSQIRNCSTLGELSAVLDGLR